VTLIELLCEVKDSTPQSPKVPTASLCPAYDLALEAPYARPRVPGDTL
jgi:hypothetical protein